MGRKRVYSNAAERQKAYRERASTPLASPAAQAPKRRQPSRPAQLAAARNIICKVKTEYQRWLDRLPDFQEGSEQEEGSPRLLTRSSRSWICLPTFNRPKVMGETNQ